MPLNPGSRLGPYEILSALGAGGMGEVYKAKDTRLDRIVAVKVLPSHLSSLPELRQRFEREARAISSLSHAHICALYDVGHQDGVDFLVMEYLEGETLAERLAKGPLPVEQILRNGIEIAEALEKAHRQGIIHRDLKPGNIMLTRAGVKLLDFGLAKTAAATPGPDLGALSTLATDAVGGQALTTEGTLLGTFQYMAPEQLEGKEADARTDLFAFGSVLYEMATGRVAFHGKSRASLISAIMSGEPEPLSAVQPLTPPAFERVVRTCLAKDPDDRWQTAHDVSLQLRWIAEGGSQVGLPAPVAHRRRSRERLAWGLAGAAGLVALALVAWVALHRPAPPVVMRFNAAAARSMASLDSPRISPDGRFIAVDATDSTGSSAVWVRPVGSLEFQSIPGTEGATRPFWSPDSRFIAFIAQGKLKKIAVTGGPATIICDASTGSDGTWGTGGVILFDGGQTDPIKRVPATGGVPVAEVPGDSGAVGWPHFLPDGKHYLYMTGATGPGEIVVGTLGSKKRLALGIHGSRAEYSPAGYLLFVRDRTLLAQPFDAGSLKLKGEPIPVAEPVGTAQGGALGHFSVSRNGVLIYTLGGSASNKLVWLDRSGKVLGQVGQPGDIYTAALSPDADRVATRIADPQTGNRDIWVLELSRGTATRFTFNAASENLPIWSPDGSRVVFCSDRNGVFDLYQKLSNGAADEESLLVSKEAKWPGDLSRDGKYLAYFLFNAQNNFDIMVLPLFGDRKPIPFVHSSFNETLPRFSPDGHWIAYVSDASGRNEIYVQPFPGPGGKWQISTAGGNEPCWRGDGKELFYLGLDSRLMSVEVKAGSGFEAGVPAPLFPMIATPDGWTRYAATSDGKRFLVVAPERSQTLTPTTVVLNWNAEVGKK
jgi:Tol biopolymer transport system component/predicted Ser/Thr protein kinase